MYWTPIIEELKNSNNVPSDETIGEVKNMLRKPLNDLHSLDAEIQSLEQRLEELKIRRNESQKWIITYQSILSPIRRLPTDTLGEIFYHCLPTHRNPIIKTTECPMLLTQICSRWRAVAIADSQLWSRLYITFSDDDLIPLGDVDGIDPQSWALKLTDRSRQRAIHMLRTRIDAVKEWVSRSGSRPLSIALKFTSHIAQAKLHSQHDPTDDITLEFFQFLASISPRFEDLELTMSIDMYRFLENMMVILEMKMLKSFRADYEPEASLFTRQGTWSTRIGMLHAPNLRKLSISGKSGSIWDASSSSQDWSRLTHLACHQSLSVFELARLLERSPNLVFFKAWIGPLGSGENDWAYSFDRQISLPFLRSLHITETIDTPLTSNLYRVIDAPLLHWISIKAGFPISHSLTSIQFQITPLLYRSSALKKLTVDAYDLPSWGVDGLFRAAPTITHLVVGLLNRNWASPSQADIWSRSYRTVKSSWNLGGLFVNRPSNIETDPPILPNLESIDVSVKNGYFSDEKLKDFVISRLNPSSPQGIKPLKHVGVYFYREKERDIEQEIRRHAELVGANIDLDLDYPDIHNNPQPRTFSPAYGLNLHNGRSWAPIGIDDTDDTDAFPS